MSKQPVQEDFLDVDQPIRGQEFVCLSFISPEDMIRKREQYLVHCFLKTLLKEKYEMDFDKLRDEFEGFRLNSEETVDKEFNELNEYRTSMKGLKVRGVYGTLKEAQVRAEVLRRKDPTFDVFVGQVGYWLPWDPENKDKVENQEYMEGELNTLMKKYKENQQKKDEFWSQEKERRVELARKEGVELNNTENSGNTYGIAYGIEDNVERIKLNEASSSSQ